MMQLRRVKNLVRRWQAAPRDEVDTKLATLACQLLAFQPQRADDWFVIKAIEQAFVAADRGNPAVGAILVSADGTILHGAGPRNLKPYFRSDLHAEMHLITSFENKRRFANQTAVQQAMNGGTLYSSLEPCTMCMARLIMSGVTKVFHAADDVAGGMVHLQENLPPVWKQLIESGNKHFGRADCSDELRDIAWQAFLLTISASGRTDLWPDASK